MHVKDQLHRTVNLPKTPSRIISLVPSQTELLVDLGLRNKIVGVTKFCVHPTDLRKEKTIVGGTKQVRLDKIEKLQPDFILCNKEENTPEMVRELEAIAPVWVTDMYDIPDCFEMIMGVGAVLNVEKKARVIVDQIESGLSDFKSFMRNKPSQTVLYSIWKNPYMVAGKDTFIDKLLKLNKFNNAITDENSRYPEVALSKMKNVDLVLLSTEPYPFKEKDVQALRQELGGNVKLVDGEFFSWYGSRLIKAFDYFKTLH